MPAKMSYRKRTIRKYTKRAPMSIPRPFGKYNEDFYASIQVNGSMVASQNPLKRNIVVKCLKINKIMYHSECHGI
jgi:hypothetical protein